MGFELTLVPGELLEAGPVVEFVVGGGLNGMPGVELKPDIVEVELSEGRELPLTSIRFEETILTEPPVCVAKVMVTTAPLPEKEGGLAMAILMEPGLLVLAARIAPEMRLPWFTDGEAMAELS